MDQVRGVAKEPLQRGRDPKVTEGFIPHPTTDDAAKGFNGAVTRRSRKAA